ncbi:MAG: ATP phosphoribosyltransferase [Leptospira sp.]|nr:ATP phosphoribosyltransferase [Leptospira sp.]
MLTLALPKGRLADESIDLLLKKKWLSAKPDPGSKELTFNDPSGKLKILFVRSQDVPTYVIECAADVGFIGWDILSEGNYDLVIPLDLKIGKCRLSLAGDQNFDLTKRARKIRVATKYPKITKEFFFQKGLSCEIIKLYGSIELAPLCGLSDCIVDLVSSGETLRANGLKEIEVILESSARLIFNRSALYQKRVEAAELIKELT